MLAKMRTLAVAMLATAGLVTMIPAGSASAATPHINVVPCNSNEFLKVSWHDNGGHYVDCFANAGVSFFPQPGAWLDNFWTGNNHVQWRGDGRWQPDSPVGKWTQFGFPNHPGGVNLVAISIS